MDRLDGSRILVAALSRAAAAQKRLSAARRPEPESAGDCDRNDSVPICHTPVGS